MASKRTRSGPVAGELIRKAGSTGRVSEKAKGDLGRQEGSTASRTRASGGGGVFSFRYSYKEMSVSGGKTRIRSKEHRFENGKLESEEFEATMGEEVYRDAADRTRKEVTRQLGSVLGVFASLLPGSPRSRDK